MNELKKRRLLSGLTQCDIEVLTGIPQCRVSLIERGYRKLNELEKKKLGRVLHFNDNEL